MTKTENLILLLCLECVRSDCFSFDFYRHKSITVNQWGDRKGSEDILRSWDIWDIENNEDLIQAIKEIRAIKRGKKC